MLSVVCAIKGSGRVHIWSEKKHLKRGRKILKDQTNSVQEEQWWAAVEQCIRVVETTTEKQRY